MANTGEGKFKDLFSGHAKEYALFRPTYPKELFASLAARVSEHDAAWDCATGNGQAAVELAPYFKTVYATDASTKQLEQATPHPNVIYSVGTAEASGLAARSVTLVTVAQAFHWFKHEQFFEEVRRVAKPGKSLLAIWVYNLARIDAAVDAVMDDYYVQKVGSYWEPERKYVDTDYKTIKVPFVELAPPPLNMTAHWTLAQLLGYIGTWSATKGAAKALGVDPVIELTPLLEKAWGDPAAAKPIRWPVAQRLFSL